MMNDTLSNVLRAVRLCAATFHQLNFAEDWAVETRPADNAGALGAAGAGHVMACHVMVKGGGWIAVDGEAPVRLEAGDVVILPRGDAHILSSVPRMRAPSVRSAGASARDIATGRAMFISTDEAAAADARTHLVCGFLACGRRPFGPLFDSLPKLMHLPGREGCQWVAAVAQEAAAAFRGRFSGSDVVLERIGEMMFVDGLRRHAEQMPTQCAGWLAGLQDRYVGRVLALIHRSPEQSWTIDALAAEAGLSRSVIYERFERLMGLSPKLYLTQWRIEVATTLLRQSRAPLASIALDVGYESEAAFSRAFKRVIGLPPARWRRMQLEHCLH